MNKRLVKFALTLTLISGAVAVHNTDADAQQIKPYYNWSGYTGYSYKFLLDLNFKKALINDNVTINGMKVATNFNNDDIREGLNAFEQLHNKRQYNKRYVNKMFDTFGYKSLQGKYFLIELPVQKDKLSMKKLDQHYGNYKIGTNVIKNKSGKVIERTVTYRTKKGIFEANFNAKNKLIDCYIAANTTTAY